MCIGVRAKRKSGTLFGRISWAVSAYRQRFDLAAAKPPSSGMTATKASAAVGRARPPLMNGMSGSFRQPSSTPTLLAGPTPERRFAPATRPPRTGGGLVSPYQSLEVTSLIAPRRRGGEAQFAFYQCTSLAEIALPPNLIEIGEYAFYQCQTAVYS